MRAVFPGTELNDVGADRERELRFQARLLDQVNCAVIATDPRGAITHWNRFAERLYGWSIDEVLGKNILDVTPPVESRTTAAEIMEELATKGSWSGEFTVRRKDGTIFPALVTDAMIRDDAGKTLGFVGISTDITDRKEAEQELKRKSEALARANGDLKHFVFAMSHDLQGPLREMVTMTRLLREEHSEALPEDASTLVGFISQAAERMNVMINDLLHYAQIAQHNGGEQAGLPVLLGDVVRRAKLNLTDQINATQAVITEDPLPEIEGDAAQFVQLFQNLLGNAIKYRSGSRPEIHLGARRQDQGWLFAVRDNGIGIESAYQNQIFQPFKRLHGPEIPGSGLGLAICERIVERHGGRIWVESTAGQGTTFFFTIPDPPLP